MELNVPYRAKRYTQILQVFVRWGVVEVTGHFLNLHSIKKMPGVERMSSGARLRMALEELGGTFVKIGQILSVRPDIVPLEVCDELRKLQDEVPSVSFDKIEPILTEIYGVPIDDVFAKFDRTPIAAASLAQVYRATMKNGEEVAVKVLRPDIRRQVENDISLMQQLTKIGEHYSSLISDINPMSFVDEFARSLRRETDLVWERRNIERFAILCKGDETVHIPKVYPELSGQSVLVMEFIDGINISEIEKLKAAGLSTEIIAQRGARLIVRSIFDFGFFHADPHPGNIFVLPDNVIAPLDYGMVGFVDDEMRTMLFDMVSGIVDNDEKRFMRGLGSVCELPDDIQMSALKRDVSGLIQKYYGLELRYLNIKEIGEDIFALFRRHKVRLPADLSLLTKALITVEGLGKTLDPNFNTVEFLQPFVKKYLFKRWNPKKLFESAEAMFEDALRASLKLPERLDRITEKLQSGSLSVKLEHRRLEKLTDEISRASNRISFALIVAALLIASALVMSIDKGPQLFGFPLVSLINYGIGVVLGLYLIFDILRKKWLR
ncbi:AarF/ABC1/UbiB kinase family protein [bacterium]|nr:AarF/ABC1/UbiB kinase family protein [bacterium]